MKKRLVVALATFVLLILSQPADIADWLSTIGTIKL